MFTRKIINIITSCFAKSFPLPHLLFPHLLNQTSFICSCIEHFLANLNIPALVFRLLSCNSSHLQGTPAHLWRLLRHLSSHLSSRPAFVCSSLKISSTMAASRPKRSVKQPLDPEFVYDFPTMVFPTDCDPNALTTPSTAVRSAVQLSSTTTPVPPVTKKKSAKSSKIHDQLELERLKQQNLQLELQLLSQKEKLTKHFIKFQDMPQIS